MLVNAFSDDLKDYMGTVSAPDDRYLSMVVLLFESNLGYSINRHA